VANQPHIFGSQFVETMPNARLQWIEECGHVPHLEQPDDTADAIASFLSTEVATEVAAAKGSSDVQPPYLIGAGFIGGALALEIANLLSQ
jgi:hypothetical protein